MSFGLNVFGETGLLTYSSDDVTWNQVDFFKVDADATVSNTYDALSGREVLTVLMFVDPPPTDQKATAPTVSVSQTTVSVTGGKVAVYILVLMR